MDTPGHDSSETVELLERARRGDNDALGELFERHRERLRLMVDLRMAEVVRGRLDASDVLQQAFLDVWRGGFRSTSSGPRFLSSSGCAA